MLHHFFCGIYLCAAHLAGKEGERWKKKKNSERWAVYFCSVGHVTGQMMNDSLRWEGKSMHIAWRVWFAEEV